MEKLRIGIIGTGGIAHAHANAYKAFDDVEVVAGADIIPGKARAFLDSFGWTEAAAYASCEELCRLFCDVDDVTYGGLKKIGFTRTKTLGYGGDCCDFHFFKK